MSLMDQPGSGQGRPSPAPPASLGPAPLGLSPQLGAAEVPQMAGAHKILASGSPTQPSLPFWKQGSENVGSTRHHSPWWVVRPPAGPPFLPPAGCVCAWASALPSLGLSLLCAGGGPLVASHLLSFPQGDPPAGRLLPPSRGEFESGSDLPLSLSRSLFDPRHWP